MNFQILHRFLLHTLYNSLYFIKLNELFCSVMAQRHSQRGRQPTMVSLYTYIYGYLQCVEV